MPKTRPRGATRCGRRSADRRLALEHAGRHLLDLSGRPSAAGGRSDGLEGFARTFLAAAFRVAGADGDDPHGWLERYASGLAAGTRAPGRDDTDSWPLILDHLVAGQPLPICRDPATG